MDQVWHMILGLLTNLPFVGSFFSVVSREYYQRKRTMEANMGFEPDFAEIMDTEGGEGYDGFDWFKKDLMFSYIGVVAGGCFMVWWLW